MTAAPLMPEIDLDPHASAADVRAFFERDRLIAAYALADLDPENVDQSRWWVARRGEDIVAAALLVEVLPFRPCFAMGEPEALAELFRNGMSEARLILATPPTGRLPIEASYRFERLDVMHRMIVRLDTFKPRVTHEITRLTAEQLYDSLHGKILKLPDHIEIFPAHFGGAACGKGLSGKPGSTIGFERRFNPALQFTSKAEFVRFVLADLPPQPEAFALNRRRNLTGE